MVGSGLEPASPGSESSFTILGFNIPRYKVRTAWALLLRHRGHPRRLQVRRRHVDVAPSRGLASKQLKLLVEAPNSKKINKFDPTREMLVFLCIFETAAHEFEGCLIRF